MKRPASTTLNHQEIAKFSDLAGQWWDPEGPMAPLHRMTPCRLEILTELIRSHFGAIKGLKILDVGCGGGLVSEPLTRLGAKVTGIDAASDLIHIARDHATEQKLNITYRTALTSDLVNEEENFDVILALEVIEHVNAPGLFVQDIARLLRPNGLAIFSTLNRTAQSFAFGIVAAEYLLRWLPQGTHDWKKFVKPSELHNLCTIHDLVPQQVVGMVYNPLTREFSLSKRNVNVNYFLSAVKDAV